MKELPLEVHKTGTVKIISSKKIYLVLVLDTPLCKHQHQMPGTYIIYLQARRVKNVHFRYALLCNILEIPALSFVLNKGENKSFFTNGIHLFYNKTFIFTRARSETGGSRMKALKMSIVHVSTFVLFWTPYSVMATW